MFFGSMVALVTPMKNGTVDVAALRKLVEFHIQSGTHAIIAAGTTGESGTLSEQEKLLVIRTVVDAAAEQIPVIAGTAANSTKACIELTRAALDTGVDAALIMTPAYIKPTQAGLLAHYRAIAQAVPIPIILYNVPSRTACDLLPETVAELASLSNIVGIKEATGDEARLIALQAACDGRMDIFSGDDPTAAGWMCRGAKGVISVTANIAPKLMAKCAEAALDGDHTRCAELDTQLMPLHRLLFIESNPIPTKWALHQMEMMEDEIRLPLTVLSEIHQGALREVLQTLHLIE